MNSFGADGPKDKPYGQPVLIYLVEQGKGSGMYCHPTRMGITAGVCAWAERGLHFQCHKDAKEFADTVPRGNVVKLRLYARHEPIRPAKTL